MTESPLIETTDKIINAIDKKQLTSIVFLDKIMSKAFDSINHETLFLNIYMQDIGLFQ